VEEQRAHGRKDSGSSYTSSVACFLKVRKRLNADLGAAVLLFVDLIHLLRTHCGSNTVSILVSSRCFLHNPTN